MIRETKIIEATHTVVRYQGGDLMQKIKSIASQKPTGALTILFAEGGILALEWRERGRYHETFGEPWGNDHELRR